jgi:hypothetical protein
MVFYASPLRTCFLPANGKRVAAHDLAAADLPDALIFRILVKAGAQKYLSSVFRKIMA